MIRRFGLGVSQRPPQRIRLEQHVGIGEKQPVARRLIRRRPHGMRLAQPSGRQFAMMNHARRWFDSGAPFHAFLARSGDFSHPLHDLARPIRRPVVHRDHFVVVVIERKQRVQRLLDRILFVARRNNNRYSRIPRRRNGIAIPLRTRNIGHGGHPERSIHDAGNPRERQNHSRNPMKIHQLENFSLPQCLRGEDNVSDGAVPCRQRQPPARISSHRTVSQTRSPSR